MGEYIIQNTFTTTIFKYLVFLLIILLFFLGSGCSKISMNNLNPKIINVSSEEMLNIKWNKGFSLAISITPGIPIELIGDSTVEYEIMGNYNELFQLDDGIPSYLSESNRTLKGTDTVYWSLNIYEKTTESWITVIRKQDKHTTGLVLIQISDISQQLGKENSGGIFKANVISSIEFPKQDGKYQNITNEKVSEIVEAYKKK